MAYRYRYNDSLLAEGERTFVLQGGRLYVRTGVLSTSADQITYRLREVYDDAVAPPPANLPPAGGDITATYPVPAGA